MKYILISVYIAIMLLSMFFADKTGYELGIVPFCSLTEADRLVVCPKIRILEERAIGSTVLYVCNEKIAYFELNNLTAQEYDEVIGKIAFYKQNVPIKKECENKQTIVYKIELQ